MKPLDLTAPPPPTPPHAFHFEIVEGREWVTVRWGGWDYDIALDGVATPLALLHWVAHLAGKGWAGMTSEEIGAFIETVCERKGWNLWSEPF